MRYISQYIMDTEINFFTFLYCSLMNMIINLNIISYLSIFYLYFIPFAYYLANPVLKNAQLSPDQIFCPLNDDLINVYCFQPLALGLLSMQQKLIDADEVFYFSLLPWYWIKFSNNQRTSVVPWKSFSILTCLQESLHS